MSAILKIILLSFDSRDLKHGIFLVYDIQPRCTKDYTIYQRGFSISYDVMTVL